MMDPRDDRIASLEAALSAEREKVERLRKALEFYANPRNWTSGRWVRGSEEDDDADDPVPHLICIDHQIDEGFAIPFADCGSRARAALQQEKETGNGE